jgi:CspA family cold shock protein
MMQGKVKFFNVKKGFGFITGEDNQDYFVHISQVPKDAVLNEKVSVNFNPTQTDRGMQAKDVKLI